MNDLSRIRKANRKISRAAVAKSLRELAILFRKKPASTNTKAPRQRGLGETVSELQANDITKNGGAV